jgi:hypothetical protein
MIKIILSIIYLPLSIFITNKILDKLLKLLKKEKVDEFKTINIFIVTLLSLLPIKHLTILLIFLYIKQLITLGALISFLVTYQSNLLTTLFTNSINNQQIIKLILLKIILGCTIGLFIDYLEKKENPNFIKEIKNTTINSKNIFNCIILILFIISLNNFWHNLINTLTQIIKNSSFLRIHLIVSSFIAIIPVNNNLSILTNLFINNFITVNIYIISLLFYLEPLSYLILVLIKSNKEKFKIFKYYFSCIILTSISLLLFLL